jgi:pimeloyl-ACP methyl ester carboxylesterase
MGAPETHYATSGDATIAYQVAGDGPIDLVLVLGFATHLELQWELEAFAHFFERLASFSRLVLFDKRGTGLSDRVAGIPDLQTFDAAPGTQTTSKGPSLTIWYAIATSPLMA